MATDTQRTSTQQSQTAKEESSALSRHHDSLQPRLYTCSATWTGSFTCEWHQVQKAMTVATRSLCQYLSGPSAPAELILSWVRGKPNFYLCMFGDNSIIGLWSSVCLICCILLWMLINIPIDRCVKKKPVCQTGRVSTADEA